MTRPVIAVMARAPSSPGKSRLIQQLGTGDGAGLRAALLRDTLDLVSALDAQKALLYTPAHCEAEMREHTPFPALFLPQHGATLGDRMYEGARDLFARGFDAIVIIGSDLPSLPTAHVSAALRLLERPAETLVLGPAEDGGYYLIGLTRPRPELFAEIPWGTPRVLERTREAAEAAGIPVETLPLWYDVDSPTDLLRVAGRAESPPAGARHTRAWLSRAFGEGG